MRSQPKKRRAFQPSLADAGLEERVVLATGTGFRNAFASGGVPVAQFLRAQVAASSQATQQLRANFLRQFNVASTALQRSIRADAAQLFANGRPTAQQIADFNARTAGAINA